MEQPNLKNIETFSVLSEVIAWYYYPKFWREKKFIKNKRKKKKSRIKMIYYCLQKSTGRSWTSNKRHAPFSILYSL